MKFKILIVWLSLGLLAGCNQPHHFNKAQLKKALFTCLNNKQLKWWLFPDTLLSKQNRVHLYGNVILNDSVKIDNRVYYIGKGTGNISRDTVFVFRLHYKTERIATIHLIYQPGTSFQIFSYCDFVFDNNTWKPQHQTTGIIDGRFKY
ncbi:hypothetical protein [Mucilaginibacter panaciglaebae]|uniref:hypothetical protein n=1 Tax=Mucilaginibacter panaciglaebae TaxID=502331 RepID=UPI0031EAFF12